MTGDSWIDGEEVRRRNSMTGEETESRERGAERVEWRLKVATHANMKMLSCQIFYYMVLRSNENGGTFE